MNKGRIIVTSDLHGNHKGLLQCLERSGFDKESDTLITLGDYVDGLPDVYEVVEELLSIKERISLLGNHDQWFIEWLKTGIHPCRWLQGGYSTLKSYCDYAGKEMIGIHGGWETDLNYADIPPSHVAFFNELALYMIDDSGRLFLHAGFNREKPIIETKAVDPSMFYWDRKLWHAAMSCGDRGFKLNTYDNFEHIFIGHTSTIFWTEKVKVDDNTIVRPITHPMTRGGVTNMDSGAGHYGRLSFMDIDTREVWSSDMVSDLYPEYKGRDK